jgi:hypothetical protein
MGTSSILAAAILAVLKTLKGEHYTMDDLIYQTLEVEQMMNTGNGKCGPYPLQPLQLPTQNAIRASC